MEIPEILYANTVTGEFTEEIEQARIWTKMGWGVCIYEPHKSRRCVRYVAGGEEI